MTLWSNSVHILRWLKNFDKKRLNVSIIAERTFSKMKWTLLKTPDLLHYPIVYDCVFCTLCHLHRSHYWNTMRSMRPVRVQYEMNSTPFGLETEQQDICSIPYSVTWTRMSMSWPFLSHLARLSFMCVFILRQNGIGTRSKFIYSMCHMRARALTQEITSCSLNDSIYSCMQLRSMFVRCANGHLNRCRQTIGHLCICPVIGKQTT